MKLYAYPCPIASTQESVGKHTYMPNSKQEQYSATEGKLINTTSTKRATVEGREIEQPGDLKKSGTIRSNYERGRKRACRSVGEQFCKFSPRNLAKSNERNVYKQNDNYD